MIRLWQVENLGRLPWYEACSPFHTHFSLSRFDWQFPTTWNTGLAKKFIQVFSYDVIKTQTKFLANPVPVAPYLGFILYTAFHSASDIISEIDHQMELGLCLFHHHLFVGFYLGAVQVPEVFNPAALLCHHPSFKNTLAIILSQLCVKTSLFFFFFFFFFTEVCR